MTTYINVAKRHVSEYELAGKHHWIEYIPTIHRHEIYRLGESFSLSKPVALTIDSTTRVDEQVGIFT